MVVVLALLFMTWSGSMFCLSVRHSLYQASPVLIWTLASLGSASRSLLCQSYHAWSLGLGWKLLVRTSLWSSSSLSPNLGSDPSPQWQGWSFSERSWLRSLGGEPIALPFDCELCGNSWWSEQVWRGPEGTRIVASLWGNCSQACSRGKFRCTWFLSCRWDRCRLWRLIAAFL